MKIILHWLISAIAIIISSYLLAGVHIDGFGTALILAVVLGLINAFLRPLLVFLTLPISILTFGLFLLVLNTLLIMLAAYIVPGVVIDSFWWALAFGIVMAILNSLLRHLLENKSSF
jgi:putative membrane protein